MRAPLCSLLFRYSQTENNEGALAREDKPRIKTTLVNRREHLAPTVGLDIKHQSHHTVLQFQLQFPTWFPHNFSKEKLVQFTPIALVESLYNRVHSKFKFPYPLELHDSQERFQMIRSTRQGSTHAESEEMTMQQLMGMMKGLQEAMAVSKAEQVRM